MITISLQSGSSGNCIYVETKGVKLLFDAGISSIEAKKRLEAFGIDIRDVNGLIISHDHGDHVRHAGVYQRKFGLPLYISRPTLARASSKMKLGRLTDINYFTVGSRLNFGHVSVQTIPSPHDGIDGSLFVISNEEKSLGIFTDLGHVSKDLYQVIPSLDAIYIESNHDPVMLSNGPYPRFLKQRVAGAKGHLSNREAAELLLAGRRLKWACLSHISEHNNTPETALSTHREIVPKELALFTASRYESTGMMIL